MKQIREKTDSSSKNQGISRDFYPSLSTFLRVASHETILRYRERVRERERDH